VSGADAANALHQIRHARLAASSKLEDLDLGLFLGGLHTLQ